MSRRGPPKYQPLAAYLTALTVDRVRLTFAEIEVIIAAPLPVTARRSAFWVNRSRPLSWTAARSWLPAGWRVLRTELHAQPPAVQFARVVSDTTAALPAPPRRSSPFTARQRRQRGTPIVDG